MFTVYCRNEALGRAHYCGTFDNQGEAQQWANTEASRTRKFATFEVYTGTPEKPGNKVPDTLVRGVH